MILLIIAIVLGLGALPIIIGLLAAIFQGIAYVGNSLEDYEDYPEDSTPKGDKYIREEP